MPAMFCSAVSRRIMPAECGTLKPCQPECELRPIIQGDTPGPQHKCGMCKKSYPEVQFDPNQKTGKPKKTCTVCEVKYVKKATPVKPTAKKKKKKPTPPSQNPISLKKLLEQAQELLTRRATVESEIARLEKERDEIADPKRFIEENLHRV